MEILWKLWLLVLTPYSHSSIWFNLGLFSTPCLRITFIGLRRIIDWLLWLSWESSLELALTFGWKSIMILRNIAQGTILSLLAKNVMFVTHTTKMFFIQVWKHSSPDGRKQRWQVWKQNATDPDLGRSLWSLISHWLKPWCHPLYQAHATCTS